MCFELLSSIIIGRVKRIIGKIKRIIGKMKKNNRLKI